MFLKCGRAPMAQARRIALSTVAIECHCKGSKLANGKFHVHLALAPSIGEPN
jgi:hypothetical protein